MLKYKSFCEDSISSSSSSSVPNNTPLSSSLGTSKDSQSNLMTSLGETDSPAYKTLNRIQDPHIKEVILLFIISFDLFNNLIHLNNIFLFFF